MSYIPSVKNKIVTTIGPMWIEYVSTSEGFLLGHPQLLLSTYTPALAAIGFQIRFNMLSSRCKQRNESIIPSLLSQHNAVLTGDMTTIDLSTAENWPVKQMVLQELQDVQDRLSETVSFREVI